MESQRVVVVVEEAAAARTAVEWAVRNFLRGGDSITLLHVYPSTRSKKRERNLRLKGFQLALSFKDLCNGIAEAKVEIIVTAGDQGPSVVSLVNKIGASTLVVGLHDQSFLYKRATSNLSLHNLNCRILAIKHHATGRDGFIINTELSQVEITRLHSASEPRSLFSISICPLGTIWKRSRRRR